MYDFVLEITHTIFKNGLTLSALGTALYVLLKQRKVKKKLAKRLPWLLEDDSETRHYIANQTRIEAKLDALSAHVGVPTCGVSEIGTAGPTSLKQPSRSSRAALFMGNLRRMKMMNKLKSRKFILAVVTGVLIVLNDGLDLGIDSETVLAFAGIVAVWITGESVVDAKRASKASEDDKSNPGEAYH